MKKLFLLFLLGLTMLTAPSMAQSETEKLISDAFGQDYLEFIKSNNPDLIVYYSFFSQEGFTIENYGKEKILANLNTIPLLMVKPEFKSEKALNFSNGPTSINIFKYVYQLNQETKKLYRIDDSGWVIVFLSAEELGQKFNEYKANK